MLNQIEKIDESSEQIDRNKLKILELEKSLGLIQEKELETGNLNKYL